jgi:hypothetical protein
MFANASSAPCDEAWAATPSTGSLAWLIFLAALLEMSPPDGSHTVQSLQFVGDI